MSTSGKQLRVGVVGVGTMGRHHVRVIDQTRGVTLSGFHDPDPDRSRDICDRHGCRCFANLNELLEECDAVSIAAPTVLHREIGQECLRRGLHVLMEKPLAHDLESAERLVTLSKEAGTVLMVGHIERYNPAIEALIEHLRREPEPVISIDCCRLSPFDGTRCLDVDVLYDLLIHDIDLALEFAGSDVTRVSATGRPVFSDRTDVAHTRIEFSNGAVAAFWTSKCSPRKVRTITVATPRRHLSADTLERTLTVYTAQEMPSQASGICFMGDVKKESVPVSDDEPLRREFQEFFRAIGEGTPPLTDGNRALAAMRVLDLVARSVNA